MEIKTNQSVAKPEPQIISSVPLSGAKPSKENEEKARKNASPVDTVSISKEAQAQPNSTKKVSNVVMKWDEFEREYEQIGDRQYIADDNKGLFLYTFGVPNDACGLISDIKDEKVRKGYELAFHGNGKGVIKDITLLRECHGGDIITQEGAEKIGLKLQNLIPVYFDGYFRPDNVKCGIMFDGPATPEWAIFFYVPIKGKDK